mgnify:CR=1 FL=1
MKVVGGAAAILLTGAKPDANVTIVSKSKGFIFVEVHVESPSMATVTASWGAWRASYCSFLREMLVASTLTSTCAEGRMADSRFMWSSWTANYDDLSELG